MSRFKLTLENCWRDLKEGDGRISMATQVALLFFLLTLYCFVRGVDSQEPIAYAAILQVHVKRFNGRTAFAAIGLVKQLIFKRHRAVIRFDQMQVS